MKTEVSALLADIKEQVLYLQELGVENFAVDLPEIESSKFKNGKRFARKAGKIRSGGHFGDYEK